MSRDPVGDPRPRGVWRLVRLLARVVVEALQPVRLLLDRLYTGFLRLLVVLVRSARHTALVPQRAWTAVRSLARRVRRVFDQMQSRRKAWLETAQLGSAFKGPWQAAGRAWRRARSRAHHFLTSLYARIGSLFARPARTPHSMEGSAQPETGGDGSRWRVRRFDPLSWRGQFSTVRASKRLRRLSSFLVKEILDVVQQPRLVATLVVGPFLILLISLAFFANR